jgi:CHAT domain-containing protein/tetratricopeptide (TPR) repeat protein
MDERKERQGLIDAGEALLKRGSYKDALARLEQCLRTFASDELGTLQYADVANFVGAAAYELNQLRRAEQMFEAARKIYTDQRRDEGVAWTRFNLGNVCSLIRGRTDEAAEHFGAAAADFLAIGEKRQSTMAKIAEVRCWLRRRELDRAREKLLEVDRLLEGESDLGISWARAFQESRLALYESEYGKASMAAEKSLEHAQTLGDASYIAQSKGLLEDIRQRATRESHRPSDDAESASAPPMPSEPLLSWTMPADVLSICEQIGRGTIIVRLGEQPFILTVPGSTVVKVIDAAAPDLLGQLDRDGALDVPSVMAQWVSYSQTAVQHGIELRQQGALVEAYLHQRIALAIVLRARNVNGLIAIVGNIWILYESMRDIVEGAKAVGTGGLDAEALRELKRHLQRSLAFIRHDAHLARQATADIEFDASDPRTVAALHAEHRIALMAGQAPLDEGPFGALLEVSKERGDVDAPVVAAAEELTQLSFAEALASTQLIEEPVSSAWRHYREARLALKGVADPARCADALYSALQHLGHLRLRATRAGGDFGHKLSYAISALVQVVGRDFVGLYHAMEPAKALEVAETLLARALVDRMGRSHGGWSMPREFFSPVNSMTGSMNASAVATLEEIHEAVQEFDLPILYFLGVNERFVAWAIRKDHRVVSTWIESPVPRIGHVLSAIRSEHRPLDGAAATKERQVIDTELEVLHEMLFPPVLREALEDQGPRVAIIVDPSLQSIPFAALRNPNGRYLLEDRELVFWPSVTARFTLEMGGGREPWVRARLDAPRKSFVLGIERFEGRSYEVAGEFGPHTMTFDDLPGAGVEAETIAKILGTTAHLEDSATANAVLREGTGAPIVHLATHAVLDERSPSQSFVALADRGLSAEQLYVHDAGLRTNLVVLSACETAAGIGNADSLLGLTNAFLAAGAGSVVSTLWPIDDDATGLFMSTFYGSVDQGEDLSSALHNAQRALLRNPSTSDTVFWAPFLLTGRTANPLARTKGERT